MAQIVPGEDLAASLARHVVRTHHRDIPPDAIRAAKQSTLDILGVSLGATGLVENMPKMVAVERDWGGNPESSLIGFGGRLPAPSAAFLNGLLAHGLDFDDHLPEGHHPSSSLLPAVFAVTQRRGGVSGEDFLTAVALGQDVFTRLRRAIVWKQDWFLTPVLGVFSATAACARILGLSEEQVLDAFGIATLQSAGTMQIAYGTGGELRGAYAGFAARAAVLSAVYAELGMTGTGQPFEGKAGFFDVHFGASWDRETVLAGLGEDFQGASVIYKPWPSCGASHAFIASTLDALGDRNVRADIARIEVMGGDFARKLSEPIESRRHPASVQDAKFNIPYPVAVAAARGRVGLGDFSDESRHATDIRAVADRVGFIEDSRLDWSREVPGGAVRITLADGTVLERETGQDATPGGSARPLTWDDLIAKFDDCATYAIRAIDRTTREKTVDAVKRLETLPDATTVIDALS